jgi:hypothetical protein
VIGGVGAAHGSSGSGTTVISTEASRQRDAADKHDDSELVGTST